MGRFLLTVAICLVLVTAVTALKCYTCSGTEDDCKKSTLESNKGKYLGDCGEGNDKQCMRVFRKKDSATLVENSCTDQVGCNTAIIRCGEYDDDRGVTCKVGCCKEDECNVGSLVSFNVFLYMLTVCSALGLALLM